MSIRFEPCELPWNTGVWGLSLRHSDTDVTPECSVTFEGMHIVEISGPNQPWWIEVEFADATFVRASPRKDDEDLRHVTGYDIPAMEGDYYKERAEWLRTGVCPDPSFYYSTDTPWLTESRQAWTARNRSQPTEDQAVHFLLNGRDGYVEVMASAYTWTAWHPGSPRRSEVDQSSPIATGGASWRTSPPDEARERN